VTGGLTLAAVLMSLSPVAPAEGPETVAALDRSYLGEWKPLKEGYAYAGRKRTFPNASRPVSQRRLATTQSQRRLSTTQARPAAMASPGRDSTFVAYAPATDAHLDDKINGLTLRTGEAGLYGVTIDALAAGLGKRPAQMRKRARKGAFGLATHSGKWQAVAWHYDPDEDEIIFAGEEYRSFHDDRNAYRFFNYAKPGKYTRRMAVANGTPPAAGEARPFRDIQRYEEEPDYMFFLWATPNDPDADYWVWDYAYGGVKDEIRVALKAPHPAPDGVAEMRIELHGGTDMYSGDDHQVDAYLVSGGAEVRIGSASWDGLRSTVLETAFDQGLLDPSGATELVLRSVYAPGTNPLQFLDQIELEYWRQPIAVDGKLSMRDVLPGAQSIAGFSDDGDILVIQDPAGNAVLRRDVRVEPDGRGGRMITFESPGADFLVAERTTLALPSVTPRYASRLGAR
jgi:hypothetical protein